jgi:hypothetical protein
MAAISFESWCLIEQGLAGEQSAPAVSTVEVELLNVLIGKELKGRNALVVCSPARLFSVRSQLSNEALVKNIDTWVGHI